MNTYATPHTRLSSLVLLIGIACCFPFAVQAQSSSITQISTVSERGVPPAAALAATPVERSAAHWTLFSGGLVDALASGHDGAQQGALRMIIFYGDQLDVKASVFDVVRNGRDSAGSIASRSGCTHAVRVCARRLSKKYSGPRSGVSRDLE